MPIMLVNYTVIISNLHFHFENDFTFYDYCADFFCTACDPDMMPSFPQHRLKRRPVPSVQNKTEEKWVKMNLFSYFNNIICFIYIFKVCPKLLFSCFICSLICVGKRIFFLFLFTWLYILSIYYIQSRFLPCQLGLYNMPTALLQISKTTHKWGYLFAMTDHS